MTMRDKKYKKKKTLLMFPNSLSLEDVKEYLRGQVIKVRDSTNNSTANPNHQLDNESQRDLNILLLCYLR